MVIPSASAFSTTTFQTSSEGPGTIPTDTSSPSNSLCACTGALAPTNKLAANPTALKLFNHFLIFISPCLLIY